MLIITFVVFRFHTTKINYQIKQRIYYNLLLSKILLPSVWWHFIEGKTVAHHRQKWKKVVLPLRLLVLGAPVFRLLDVKYG